MSILDGFFSLGNKTNKLGGEQDETIEGVATELEPELDLKMDDEELLALTKRWQREWDNSKVKQEWTAKAEANENYWLGKQFGKAEIEQLRPVVDNLIFESLETFLPQATRRNPEPNVQLQGGKEAEKNPQAMEFADAMEIWLATRADSLKLRLKIKKAARHWAIYLLGVAKVGWSLTSDAPTIVIVKANKLILDPDCTVDEDGYTGEFIGEYREASASVLVRLVPKKKQYITDLVNGQMGTSVRWIEWWTPEYLCWTLNDQILLKKKNPHWNYDQAPGQTVDDYGQPTAKPAQDPLNHFLSPKMPYIFLSIFNLGKQPVDDTSLIGQNLSNQDLINKRLKQIDKNADSMNNGLVVSEERSGLTKDQAAGVTEALRKGGTVVIPTGAPRDAVDRFPAAPLPADLYNQLVDVRTRLRDTFGTRGSSPAGIQNEDTVRGKVLVKGLDTDRIGGGITEYLEQFADDAYNWMIQLRYVYDATMQLLPQPVPMLVCSVKEGSLLPKDNVTQANQAIELWSAGALDPITLFEKLEYPNPEETAKRLFLWKAAPQQLFQNDPEVQQVIQQQQAAAQAQQAQAQAGQPPPGPNPAEMQASAQQADQQHGHAMEAKAFDHASKMAQLAAKQKGDQLLAQAKPTPQ